jgi:MFS family permease
LLGGVVDRTSRLGCAIAADLVRAAAFIGIVLVDSTTAIIALALLAGLATALFRPATSALLPSLVSDARLAAANGLYGGARQAGYTLGPACAGAMLLVVGPEAVLCFNGATFALSALLLARLRGHVRSIEDREDGMSLLADTRTGLRTVLREPLARILIGGAGAIALTTGLMNVAELVLATEEFGAGGTGLAILISAYGIGMIGGALLGARDDDDAGLRQRYLLGLALLAAGMLGSAAAPTLALACLTFAVTGVGNGLYVVCDRVLLQRLIPPRLHGRAFGLLDSVDSWGFGAAVVLGGVLASTSGSRATFAIGGAASVIVVLVATHCLRREAEPALRPAFTPAFTP